jgi:excisionase family DNA binding protein
MNDAQRRYEKSAKGRATRKRYRKTLKKEIARIQRCSEGRMKKAPARSQGGMPAADPAKLDLMNEQELSEEEFQRVEQLYQDPNFMFSRNFPYSSEALHLPPRPPGEFMTTEEVSELVRVSVKTIRRWVSLNVFPFVQLPGAGRDYRFLRSSVLEWPHLVK